ncbi:hypothetical protein SERLADRAFT_417695 [Serpula lacrymans var. lacrymans S7.9]|uniref:Uncharacterized protein n=1 Tax=Serpula lacrymans var. lacrymans (strain S7.9) TaxID=578457 RepID=F8P7L0_SERL9|nr:uncharacterized protein SERLADRAFT_417695 [Serpula lacrymans var. lacrymans S7.9]EGO21421.1 hypothetical protein SERLADRAFT_417695 [Serpula lacrymans var. lacrymans S7.9]
MMLFKLRSHGSNKASDNKDSLYRRKPARTNSPLQRPIFSLSAASTPVSRIPHIAPKSLVPRKLGTLTTTVRPPHALANILISNLDAQNSTLKRENKHLKDCNRRLVYHVDTLDSSLSRTSRELEVQRKTSSNQAQALKNAKNKLVKLEEAVNVNIIGTEHYETNVKEQKVFNPMMVGSTSMEQIYDFSLLVPAAQSTPEAQSRTLMSSSADSFESIDEMISNMRWTNIRNYQSWKSKLNALGIHSSQSLEQASELGIVSTGNTEIAPQVQASGDQDGHTSRKDLVTDSLPHEPQLLSTTAQPNLRGSDAHSPKPLSLGSIPSDRNFLDKQFIGGWLPQPEREDLCSILRPISPCTNASSSIDGGVGQANIGHATMHSGNVNFHSSILGLNAEENGTSDSLIIKSGNSAGVLTTSSTSTSPLKGRSVAHMPLSTKTNITSHSSNSFQLASYHIVSRRSDPDKVTQHRKTSDLSVYAGPPKSHMTNTTRQLYFQSPTIIMVLASHAKFSFIGVGDQGYGGKAHVSLNSDQMIDHMNIGLRCCLAPGRKFFLIVAWHMTMAQSTAIGSEPSYQPLLKPPDYILSDDSRSLLKTSSRDDDSPLSKYPGVVSTQVETHRRKALSRIQITCFILHGFLIIVHIALLVIHVLRIGYLIRVRLGLVTDVVEGVVYSAALVYVTHRLAVDRHITSCQALTTTHDCGASWNGLGAAFFSVCRQRLKHSPGSVSKTLYVLVYLAGISILHVTCTRIVTLQVDQEPAWRSGRTISAIPPLTKELVENYPWGESSLILPFMGRLLGLTNYGWVGSTLYDLPLDQAALEAIVPAKEFNWLSLLIIYPSLDYLDSLHCRTQHCFLHCALHS